MILSFGYGFDNLSMSLLNRPILKGNTMHKFLHFNNYYLLNQERSKAVKRKYQSRTVATQPLDDKNIRLLATAFLNKEQSEDIFVHLAIGVTFLSFKDKYNRASGREEALKKLKLEKIKVRSVEITNTHVFVRLESFQGVNLNLRTSKVSGFSTVTGELVVS